MGRKRKPTGPLLSEASSKIRRINSDSDHDGSQFAAGTYTAHVMLAMDKISKSQRTGEYNSSTNQDGVCTLSEAARAPLTKANLRRLEKMTNTGSKSGESVYSSKAEETTKKTPSEGVDSYFTIDSEFEKTFRANGGLTIFESEQLPPCNEAEIKAYMDQPRRSPSPTSSDYQFFLRGRSRNSSDRDIQNRTRRQVLRDVDMDDKLLNIDYGANLLQQWVAFPKNVGFNNSLPAPKPDWIEGYAQRSFPASIRQMGGAATLIHSQPTFIGLPHFAAEVKAYGDNKRKAEVLAGYDGAHMAFARNKALEFIEDKDPPRRASPVTVATDAHFWVVYSHYAQWCTERDMLEYCQVYLFLQSP